MWRKPPHGLSIPYVKNEMSRDVFEFMQRKIYFYDNSKIKEKGVRGYDPLFKVIYTLEITMKVMRGVWISRKHVNIYKSMIKYIGRDIKYIQYMPAKLIKHGIQVFAICCAISTILLVFKV